MKKPTLLFLVAALAVFSVNCGSSSSTAGLGLVSTNGISARPTGPLDPNTATLIYHSYSGALYAPGSNNPIASTVTLKPSSNPVDGSMLAEIKIPGHAAISLRGTYLTGRLPDSTSYAVNMLSDPAGATLLSLFSAEQLGGHGDVAALIQVAFRNDATTGAAVLYAPESFVRFYGCDTNAATCADLVSDTRIDILGVEP